ncbi:MAG: hypothetical protein M3329_00795, partial [Pseudomonadota bacterium]|nr:hypothetical protein [Pseudomonadota bacterium]
MIFKATNNPGCISIIVYDNNSQWCMLSIAKDGVILAIATPLCRFSGARLAAYQTSRRTDNPRNEETEPLQKNSAQQRNSRKPVCHLDSQPLPLRPAEPRIN